MAPRTLEEYVHWVLSEDKTLDNLEPEVREQLEADYVHALEDEVTTALVAALPEEHLAELEKKLDDGKLDELQGWIEERVPGTGEIIATILVRFRNDYVSADDVL